MPPPIDEKRDLASFGSRQILSIFYDAKAVCYVRDTSVASVTLRPEQLRRLSRLRGRGTALEHEITIIAAVSVHAAFLRGGTDVMVPVNATHILTRPVPTERSNVGSRWRSSKSTQRERKR